MSDSNYQEMDSLVVKFLSNHGVFPAIKDREEQILAIEQRLSNKLRRLQMGLETQFIQALREKGYIPGSTAYQMGLIAQILAQPFEDMKNVISDESLEGAEIGRQLTFEDIIEQGMTVQATAFNEEVAKQLRERVYTFSTDTFNRVQGDFGATLTHAYENGIGEDEAVRLLRADFKDLRDNRLQTIARTEIQGAQNEAINTTMQEVGIDFKQWLTVGDSRVRGSQSGDKFDHVSLHGEVVKMDEVFSNGLMHPLDRSGRIGDWISCRCRMRPYIPKRNESILTTPYYPSSAA